MYYELVPVTVATLLKKNITKKKLIKEEEKESND